MGRSERRKGADGEREVAAIFRERGFDCDRTPNSGGLRWRGDLFGLEGVHVEVKRCETARPWAWVAQAALDAAADAPWDGALLPLVAFRRSRSSWYAIVPLDELVRLLAEAQA